MRLKLTLLEGERRDDVVVTVDANATIGTLAEWIDRNHPRHRNQSSRPKPTLVVNPGTTNERFLPASSTVGEAGVRSGDSVALTPDSDRYQATREASAPAATLHLLSGPDAPKSFPLHRGTNVIGRDRGCDVRLADPMVSKQHAKLNVTETVEIVDNGSANGVLISGQAVPRAVLRPGDTAVLGETTITVSPVQTASAAGAGGSSIEFNRSPRLDPRYPGVELVAPEPPQRPQSTRFPLIPAFVPVLLGCVLYLATRSLTSILFVALSPVMMVGSYLENRIAGRKAFRQATEQFRASLTDLAVQLQQATDTERRERRREHPSVPETVEAVRRLAPLLWTRRPEHESFLELRLGLGVQASRNTVRLPASNSTTPELWKELTDVAGQFSTVDRVPVVARLRECGSLGVAGPEGSMLPLARGVVAQLVGLHSPAEVVLAAVASSGSASRWEWLKWLPHVGSDHSPLTSDHLAVTEPAALNLVAEIEDLINGRAAERRGSDSPLPLPVVVLLVEDDAPIERSRLVGIAESGRPHGVHVVWCAPSVERLPATCRTYLVADPNTGASSAGFVIGGSDVTPMEVEPLDEPTAVDVARRLAPLVDSGARPDDLSDLPQSVSFLAVGGRALGSEASAVIERWQETGSLPDGEQPKRRKDATLRALVGQTAADPFFLDLRTQGPHALVGGTTGSGKSEFLQTWILGMASAHSPARVTFLLVDYKGGAAFADCVHLPHTVGLVTDLSPHLVRRALTSLNAELTYREHILNRKKAKDLLELERRSDPETPPALVIVVDEFAALVAEVPEFVDGVVNVAQRGRSLGLHLILATQRPAGVIKDNLRANTNLRVALRMADEADSTDVVGAKEAALFPPDLPGRALAKTGPGRLAAFQAGYVGGWTSDEPPKPKIAIESFRFGPAAPWEEVDEAPVVENTGPNDIKRVVTTIVSATERIALPAPRKPWLPELAPVYRLEELPTARTDRSLVFGVCDVPERQEQPTVAFEPDQVGNLAVFGTGGTGKSTFLRTLGIAAGLSARGGPCFVYGLDFGARGLQQLEHLPHVGSVINGEDYERVVRLLRRLRSTIDERAVRYAKVSADSIEQYRTTSGDRSEPRILLLVDGMAAFRQAYEIGERSRWFDVFQQIAADGRPVGVHVAASADRPASIPSALGSAIQQRLVLRLASEMDYVMLGAPTDAFTVNTPPGRGFLDGHEVQVAVFGGDRSLTRQAAEVEKLAASMARAGVQAAPRVESLTDRVSLTELPATVAGLPTIGVLDETLGPSGIDPTGVFLVAGPPQSGRTTALATLAVALLRTRAASKLVYVGNRRSPLRTLVDWYEVALTDDDAAELAGNLTARLVKGDPELERLVVFVEGIADFLNGSADLALQDLVKACRANDAFVVAEGETSTISGSWPLLQAVKATRYGIVLQPDQMDGDTLFRTSFPRTNRAEFPPGRGLLVRGGRVERLQVALPD